MTNRVEHDHGCFENDVYDSEDYVPCSSMLDTSAEQAEEILEMFASGVCENGPMLDHLFSITFTRDVDYDLFFEKLLQRLEPPSALLCEFVNFQLMSQYLENEDLVDHPMMKYLMEGRVLPKIFNQMIFSENPESEFDYWQWLDYILENDNLPDVRSLKGKGLYYVSGLCLIKASRHCDLDEDADKFERYFQVLKMGAGVRFDAVYSRMYIEGRMDGKTLKELDEEIFP